MIENVIVTVRLNGTAESVDMELPAHIAYEHYAGKLFEALSEMYPAHFEQCERVELAFNNVKISDEDNLYGLAVWDGSILTATGKKGGV